MKKLIFSIFLCELAGIIGGLFTSQAIPTWYADLEKPFFNPPSWIFGPVWIVLYALMGISIYLIWKKTTKGPFVLFWIHLFFNATWSIVFFGLKNPGLAFLNILIIWILILVLMIKFWKINKYSTYLLIPYFLWVSFASILNYFIWYLN